MKITASIGVIDEIECLERCVNHHESIGIDSFVITDLGSTDGTKDVLNRLCRRQNVRILEAGQNLTESEWPRAMQEFAYECFKPEYIVYIDPDEFWLPLSGSLSRYREFDVISARRYNVIPDARLAAGDWRTQAPPDNASYFGSGSHMPATGN
ncbi:MAG: glycosyltransferase family 2 protein [Ignavibacteriota bacterium]